jgi:hypothetical protein
LKFAQTSMKMLRPKVARPNSGGLPQKGCYAAVLNQGDHEHQRKRAMTKGQKITRAKEIPA